MRRAPSIARLARRDLVRHRGVAWLVLLLIGLPVLVTASVATWTATSVLDPDEMVTARFGAAQARFDWVEESSPSPTRPSDRPAWARQPVQRVQDEITEVMGTDVLPVALSGLIIDSGLEGTGLGPEVQTLQTDGRSPLARGMVELESGRWPQTATEILAGREAAAAGLTPGTSVVAAVAPGWEIGTSASTAVPGPKRTYTVVGTVSTRAATANEISIVMLPDGRAHDFGFLVARAPNAPEVETLSTLSLSAETRATQRAETGTWEDENAELLLLIPVAAFLLLLLGTVAAAPAWALIAARQRRTVAHLLAMGATPAQVGGILTRQALILGAMAVGIGLTLGIPFGLVMTRWFTTGDIPGSPAVPPVPLLLIAGAAMTSSYVLGRTPGAGLHPLMVRPDHDERAAVAPPVSHRRTVLGLTFLGSGLALWLIPSVAVAVGSDPGGWRHSVLPGLVAVSLGMLLTIPAVIDALGRLRLPLLARLATRDLVRRRDLSTPVVAAVMGSTILLGGLGVLGSAIPTDLSGVGQVTPSGGASVPVSAPRLAEMRAEIDRRAPGTEVHLIATAAGATHAPHPMSDPLGSAPGWILVPPGCSVQQVNPWSQSEGVCGEAPGTQPVTWLHLIAIVDPRAARTVQQLPPDAVSALERGEMLVSSPDYIANGTVTLHPVRGGLDESSFAPTEGRPTTVPARAVGPFPIAPDLNNGRYDAVVTPETAARIGMTWNWGRLAVVAPDGRPLSEEQRDGLRMVWVGNIPDEVVVDGWDLGAGSSDLGAPLLWPAVVLSLMLIAVAAASTALMRLERRGETSTLVAVGARPHHLRGIAAIQAAVSVALGCLLGIVCTVPATMAQAVLSSSFFVHGSPPGAGALLTRAVGAVPWTTMTAASVLTCLGAALVASALTDTRRSLDRRAS